MANLNDHIVHHSKPHLRLQANETKALVVDKPHVLTWRFASADDDSGHIITWTPSGSSGYDANKGVITLHAPGTYHVIGSWCKQGAVRTHCSVVTNLAINGQTTTLPASPAFDIPADLAGTGFFETSFYANECNDFGVMQMNTTIHVLPQWAPAKLILTATTNQPTPSTQIFVRGCNNATRLDSGDGSNDGSFIDIMHDGP